MKFVEPIKDNAWVEEFENYFKEKNPRDYVMFLAGTRLGLRISDILPMRVRDVRGTHITIYENKTRKERKIIIEPKLKKVFDEYTSDMKNTDLLFPSRKKSRTGKVISIGRKSAYDILRKAAKEIGYEEPIGTHSMRKTFGYRYYKKYEDIGELQRLFNHEKQKDTLRYIGLEQEDFDNKVAHLY